MHRIPKIKIATKKKKSHILPFNFYVGNLTKETFLNKRTSDSPLANKTYGQLTPPIGTNYRVI